MPKIIPDKQIFDAVVEVVSDRGYAGASTKQIAELAGVSEVTLFRKYESKANLVQQAIAGLIRDFDVIGTIRYTGDMEDDLTRVVEKYRQMMKSNGRFMVVLLTEIPRHEELEDAVDSPLVIMKSFAELMARYMREGRLKQEAPLQALGALIGPMMYLGMMGVASNGIVDTDFDPRIFVDGFLSGRRIG